jgi:ABC-type nitrate/sulfonate/bicarbonate transport system substrate-binding protein
MSLPQLRIGFIPLADSAPLVIAQELGFFESEGVAVHLHKAQSWEQILTKLAKGEVDAAHMLVTMPLAWRQTPVGAYEPLVYAVTLGQHGNGITVGNRLWNSGLTETSFLPMALKKLGLQRLRFGVVHPGSTHEVQIRLWLKRSGLDASFPVERVTAPPQEMVNRLRHDEIDLFCAGEPWGQRAVVSKLGYLVATSADILPPCSEKVLAVRRRWHSDHTQGHQALIRAVIRASAWLDNPENCDQAAGLLAEKRYVNTTRELIAGALKGQLKAGREKVLTPQGFLRFFGDGANEPNDSDARWYSSRLSEFGLVGGEPAGTEWISPCLYLFYEQAVAGLPYSREDLFRSGEHSEMSGS